MQRHDAVATLYLVEQRHNNDWSVKKKAHHDSGELAREAKLSDAEVSELLASGRFELGGHSATHADFSKLSIYERRREIVDSKAALEARFGVTLVTYAYPFGIYDTTDVALVREAGFSAAVTTREGISRDLSAERFELRRIKVSGRKGRGHFRRSLGLGLSGWW
jgi:peptidoglycan/xylan/chitin deacetylase (PgdA/CDA1 family)